MLKSPTLIVVIPAYNEEGCIEHVVWDWHLVLDRIVPNHRIVIIDDGSRDRTGAILDSLAERIEALTVIHQPNSGHGGALLSGYKAALALQGEWIFQVDSDDQFETGDFIKLWERRSSDKLIMGHRVLRNDPPHRLVITKVLNNILNILFSGGIADANVPFRLIHCGALLRALPNIPPETFAPNIFLTVICPAQGMKVEFVPVRHKKRETGKISIVGLKLIKSLAICCKQIFKLKVRELTHGLS